MCARFAWILRQDKRQKRTVVPKWIEKHKALFKQHGLSEKLVPLVQALLDTQVVTAREAAIVNYWVQMNPDVLVNPYIHTIDMKHSIDRTHVSRNQVGCVLPGSRILLMYQTQSSALCAFRVCTAAEQLMLQGMPREIAMHLQEKFGTNLCSDLAGNAFNVASMVASLFLALSVCLLGPQMKNV